MKLALSFLMLLITISSYGTHRLGAELNYKQIPGSDSLFIVTFIYYSDCGVMGSSIEPPNTTLCIANSCNSQVAQVSLPMIMGATSANPMFASGDEIYNPCNDSTTCTNINSTVNGYRIWIYQDTISLPFACNSWRLSHTFCCRIGLTTNYGPQSPSAYNFYLEAFIDNSVYNYNNSPVFLYDTTYDKLPIPQVEVNMPYIHTGGAMDPDGDSLVFETIKARNNNTTFCMPNANTSSILLPTYNVLDSAGNPFSTNNTYFLDKHTGHYMFIPALLGYSGLAHKVSEYRNGQLIGSVMRDFAVVNATGGDYHIDSVHVCPGDSYTFPNLLTLTNLQSDTFIYSYLMNTQGCDSTVLSIVDVVNFVDTMLVNGNILTSLEIDSTTTFQWITCNPVTVLIGDTTNTLVAPQIDEYAVVMSKYGCTDTSNCVFVTSIPTSMNTVSDHLFSIHPIPANNRLRVQLAQPFLSSAFMEIYDATGRKVFTYPVNDHDVLYDMNIENLPNGVYHLRLGHSQKRFIKN